MDDLRTINAELKAVLNLCITSTSGDALTFPQHEVHTRLKRLLGSAKHLELWFVEELHKNKFPPKQSEVERLRAEVSELRESLRVKTDALESVRNQAPEWVKETETLHARQLAVMFELAPPQSRNEDSTRPRNVSTSATDDLWWGQQTTDESEDL